MILHRILCSYKLLFPVADIRLYNFVPVLHWPQTIDTNFFCFFCLVTFILKSLVIFILSVFVRRLDFRRCGDNLYCSLYSGTRTNNIHLGYIHRIHKDKYIAYAYTFMPVTYNIRKIVYIVLLIG